MIPMMYLPMSLRVTSLALGQSYDCPSASGATLKDMGKINHYQAQTKQSVNHVLIFMDCISNYEIIILF